MERLLTKDYPPKREEDPQQAIASCIAQINYKMVVFCVTHQFPLTEDDQIIYDDLLVARDLADIGW